jgi:hypothetical protein
MSRLKIESGKMKGFILQINRQFMEARLHFSSIPKKKGGGKLNIN